MTRALLDVHDLHVAFPGEGGPVRAVNGATFSVAAGERVGLVGESGSGKSVTGLSIMGLQAPAATVSGLLHFAGEDLLGMDAARRRALRGDRMAMVFPNPLGSLNPAMTVGSQIVEAITAHNPVRRRAARRQAVELLGSVGIAEPQHNVDEYPHRFSGGMRQRAMIAMALCCGPQLLIADEPTTALDVRVQAQIIDLLTSLSEQQGMAVLLITHDLAVVAGFAERVVVLYAGRVMEDGPVDEVYAAPAHPYTSGLMASIPRVDASRGERLAGIAGTPPSAERLPEGCVFHPRCPHVEPICREEIPRLAERGVGHPSACHFAAELQGDGI